MSRQRLALVASAILLGGLTWTPRGGAQQAAQQTIRLGTLAPQGTSYHRILQAMGERWRTVTNGRVKLVVYAGTMGSEVELVRRMRLGQLHAAALTVTGIGEIDPTVNALQLMPMMFRTLDEAEWVRTRLQPQLEQRLLDRGFVVLFWADAGWVRYFARAPAVRAEDFRRLKIFVTAGDIAHYDLMRSEGYSPVSLEWSDALTALQTGMIDAVPTIPYYALAGQFYTVAKHMLAVNWVPLVGATIISKRVWDALPPETQSALRAAAADAGRDFQRAGRMDSDSAVAAMQRRGLLVHPLPPDVEAEWRTMAERLYPRIRGTMVPADWFDQVQRLVAEYRASHPSGQ